MKRFGTKLIAVISIAGALIMATAAGANAAGNTTTVGGGPYVSSGQVLLSHSGYTGGWNTDQQSVTNDCYGTSNGYYRNGMINTLGGSVGASPSFSSSSQTIYMIPNLQYWDSSTSSWKYWASGWGTWQSKRPYGSYPVYFEQEQVPATPGWNYRVVEVFQWFVNGQKVGEDRYVFDTLTYQAMSVGATVGGTAGNPGWCFIK